MNRGYVGFSDGQAGDSVSENSLFHSLCDQGKVSECRFGLALGIGGTGTMIWGGVDHGLLDLYPPYSSSDLSFVPLEQDGQWSVLGSVVYLKGSKRSQHFILDTSVSDVMGPRTQVRRLFEQYNMIAHEQHLPGCSAVLHGYFNCSAPPSIGFKLGTALPRVLYMHPVALNRNDNGKDNCTAAIVGVDFDEDAGDSTWKLGQAFFQGKYLDFDYMQRRVGVGDVSSLAALHGMAP